VRDWKTGWIKKCRVQLGDPGNSAILETLRLNKIIQHIPPKTAHDKFMLKI
jgi:hypothetical protein